MPTPEAHAGNAAGLFLKVAASPEAAITTATTAVTSPWWLPWLTGLNHVAALLLPILGCILAGLQIYAWATKIAKPQKE